MRDKSDAKLGLLWSTRRMKSDTFETFINICEIKQSEKMNLQCNACMLQGKERITVTSSSFFNLG